MSVQILKWQQVSVQVSNCQHHWHKLVIDSNIKSLSLSLASALHQFANSTTLIASALVLKFSAFFLNFYLKLRAKQCQKLCLLFEGTFYSRAPTNRDFTVNTISKDRILLDNSSSFLCHYNLQLLLSFCIGIHAYLGKPNNKTCRSFCKFLPSNPSILSFCSIPFFRKICI